MARTRKTTEATKTDKPKRGRPPKAVPVAVVEAPKKRGRPPKAVQPEQNSAGAVKARSVKTVAKPEAPQRPGLVSMAPATKVQATRTSSAKTEPKKNVAKVAPVQHEQILAEELNDKVMKSDTPVRGRGRPPKAPVAPAELVRKTAPAPRLTAKKQQVVSVPPSKVASRRHRRLAWAFVWIIILAACGIGGYFYKNHRTVEAAQSPDQALIQAVAKRALLPTDETPSISTVVDASQVNQPFLEGAKNGDKVLLFFQAGKAIVYRPSTGQIVNMGSLQQPEPQVFVRKGSPTADTSKIASTITASKQFAVASQDVSPINNYSKTIVVDVVGNRPDMAQKLADLLHATVAPLPQGETPPDADLLVIVGSDVQ